MSTARQIMHQGVECIGENESLLTAARKMRELDIGSLPICGADDRLYGIITDRDIVVKCVAYGSDPALTQASELAKGMPFWVSADASGEEVLEIMEEHAIRRLPVIDEHKLIGMISEADIARFFPSPQVAEFVGKICSAA